MTPKKLFLNYPLEINNVVEMIRELNKEEISKESILNRLKYVDTAVKEITDVLNQLNSIKEPVMAQYTKNIKMIKVEEENG